MVLGLFHNVQKMRKIFPDARKGTPPQGTRQGRRTSYSFLYSQTLAPSLTVFRGTEKKTQISSWTYGHKTVKEGWQSMTVTSTWHLTHFTKVRGYLHLSNQSPKTQHGTHHFLDTLKVAPIHVRGFRGADWRIGHPSAPKYIFPFLGKIPLPILKIL